VLAGAAALALAVVGLAIGYVRVSGEQAKARVALRRAEDRTTLARQAVDEMYSRFAADWLAKQPKLEPVQREFLEAALRFYEVFARERGDDPEAIRAAAGAYRNVGQIRQRLGDVPGAESAYRDGLALLRNLPPGGLGGSDGGREEAKLLNNLAVVLLDRGRTDEALATFRAALTIKEGLAEASPRRPEDRQEVVRSLSNLAVVLLRNGQPDEAERAFREAIVAQERLLGGLPQGPDGRATRLEQTATLAQLSNNLGLFLRTAGRVAESEAPARRSVDLMRGLIEGTSSAEPGRRQELARALNNLGSVRALLGRWDVARRSFEEAIGLLDRLAADAPTVVEYRRELGLALGNLAGCLNDSGRPDEARPRYDRAVSTLGRLVAEVPTAPDYPRQLAAYQADYARLLALPRYAPPEDVRRAVDLAAHALAASPDDPSRRFTLGLARYRAGDLDAVIRDLEAAKPDRAEGRSGADLVLAMALWRRDRRDGARAILARAAARIAADPKAPDGLVRLRDEATALIGPPAPPAAGDPGDEEAPRR
jgi:tetratricopeptide (TPR) repeat protein